jgi:hypothetical protein
VGPGTSTNSDWRIKERLDENGLGQRTERLAKRVRSLMLLCLSSGNFLR